MKALFSTTILLTLMNWALAQSPAKIVGKWKGEDQPDKHSEIYLAKDGFYYGKIIFDEGKMENIGKIMLKQLTYNEATKTFKGKMSPPDMNMEVGVTISFEGEDKLKIVAKKFLMSKTIYFLRIN